MKVMLFLTVVVVCAGAGAQSKHSGAHESHIPIQGARLYCREVGRGEPMIVLHGGPDFDISYLLPELDRLSDKFHLIYYDQRGRGRSADSVKPEDVTLESEMADLDEVREHFHLDMNRVLIAILFLFLPASSLADDLFDIKPVADGIYAAIAKPAYKLNCNAAIIILDDAVLVVDTHSKPSAARVLIEQIKKLTPKPVKFVVNTHFHWDHYQGNEAYPSSWPAGVEIISSEATRTNIEQRGIPRVKHEIVTMPAQIEQLKADLQKASTSEQRASIQKDISEAEAYLTELKSMQITLPTMTFDRSLMLYRKTRTVEILWLGRAHTDGDVFVFLPREKVLVTGDALHGWTPYMGDSYPYDWIKTLDVAEKLDFDYVIGGHGDVMRGKETFELWKQYFRDLLDQTAAAYAGGATLDQAKKQVSDYLVSKYAARFDPKFPQSVGSNVIKAYQVIAFAP